jgi:hypothetical protein
MSYNAPMKILALLSASIVLSSAAQADATQQPAAAAGESKSVISSAKLAVE